MSEVKNRPLIEAYQPSIEGCQPSSQASNGVGKPPSGGSSVNKPTQKPKNDNK